MGRVRKGTGDQMRDSMTTTYSAQSRCHGRGWSVVVVRTHQAPDGTFTRRQVALGTRLTKAQRATMLRDAKRDPEAAWVMVTLDGLLEAAEARGVGETPASVAKARRRRLDALPYAEDPEVQAFVREHPDGATLVEIGDFFGVTRERIRQLEAEALQSLAIALGRIGVREAPTSDITSWCDGADWRVG